MSILEHSPAPLFDPASLVHFDPADQDDARALILAGLVEHWGWLDETRNPDLQNIAESYAGGCFLVARQEGRLVGTGALLPTPDPSTWQIVRMSVAADCRRAGLGRLILSALEHEARQRGALRLILETTATWHEVIAFYLRCGFQIISAGDSLPGQAGSGFPTGATNPSGSTRLPAASDVYFEKWL